jgi:large subunit ribosomal protein L25
MVLLLLRGTMKMTTVLQAKTRETGKRSTLTQLRKKGQLAAVLYGYQTESIPISLDYKQTAKEVQKNGYTSVFKIDIDGEEVNAVLTDIQRCALKGHVKHVDFLSINMSEELEVDVPVVLTGESIGVRDGGVITQPNHTLKIKVKPGAMPDSVEVDVSKLAVGDTLSVADVRDQFEFTIVNDDIFTIVTVNPPASLVENVDPGTVGLTAENG